MSKIIPSTETSCLCDCGCFLIAMESCCPICGAPNPCHGNKSDYESEAEGEWEQENDEPLSPNQAASPERKR